MDQVEQKPEQNTTPPAASEPSCSFIDRNGDEWLLELDYGLVDQIKAELGHNLEAALEDDKSLSRILFQERSTGLVPILFAICEEQAKERGIEPDQWPRIFDRGTIERSTEALIGAISTFLYGSRIGTAVREQTLKLARQKEDVMIARVRSITLDEAGAAGSRGSSPPAAGSRTFRRSASANSKS